MCFFDALLSIIMIMNNWDSKNSNWNNFIKFWILIVKIKNYNLIWNMAKIRVVMSWASNKDLSSAQHKSIMFKLGLSSNQACKWYSNWSS